MILFVCSLCFLGLWLFIAFMCFFFFFFNDTATTEIYTLSLHDALPISGSTGCGWLFTPTTAPPSRADRKSTRLNSSHEWISYAVFCLKKKKKTPQNLAPEETNKKTQQKTTQLDNK